MIGPHGAPVLSPGRSTLVAIGFCHYKRHCPPTSCRRPRGDRAVGKTTRGGWVSFTPQTQARALASVLRIAGAQHRALIEGAKTSKLGSKPGWLCYILYITHLYAQARPCVGMLLAVALLIRCRWWIARWHFLSSSAPHNSPDSMPHNVTNFGFDPGPQLAIGPNLTSRASAFGPTQFKSEYCNPRSGKRVRSTGLHGWCRVASAGGGY